MNEFSECVVHDEGDTVRLEWTYQGYAGVTRVADPIVEQYVATENDIRALRREVSRLRGLLAEANETFDECTGDYPKELVAEEPWRLGDDTYEPEAS